MDTERKKWDFNCPQFVHFSTPTTEISDTDSYFAIDHENNALPKDVCRTPLSAIDCNIHFNEATNSGGSSEKHKNAKSTSSKKSHSNQKKSVKTHDYNLRQTPSRLTRMNLQDENDSDEYIDASEFIHDSPDCAIQGTRMLRSYTSRMTSTAIRPSTVRFQLSPNEPMIPEEDRRTSYIVHNSKLNPYELHDATPYPHKKSGKRSSESESETPVEKSPKYKRDTSTEKKEDRRGSYIVTKPRLNLSEIPCTPICSENVQRSSSDENYEDIFEVKYTKHSSPKIDKSLQAKSKYVYTPRARKNTSNARRVVLKRHSQIAVSNKQRRKTVVQPFNFRTDARCSKWDQNQSLFCKEVNFKATLRHNTPKGKAKTPRLTKLSPFSFDQSQKKCSKGENNVEEYQPLAEKIAAHFKTPTRFRSVSRLTVFKPTRKRYSQRLVQPQTPNLQAVKRSRPVKVLSHEEELELVVQQMKQYQFHARPFNPELLNHPQLLKFPKKPPTIPESIELETEKRILTRKCTEKPAVEEKYEFHAQKIPKGILEGPVGLKEKLQMPVTKPVSPAFALRNREQKWKSFSHMDTSETVFRFKAKPAPTPKPPQSVRKSSIKTMTSFEPFSFDEKDKQRFARKEQKIQEIIEKENKPFEFHAQKIPMSVFTPRPMTRLSKTSITVPQPFDLHVDKLALKRNSEKRESVVPKVQNKPKFKAKPATVLKKLPFVPEKTVRPIIEILEFNLSTEARALEKERLKEERMSVNIEKELAAERYRQEQEVKEKIAIRQLRRQLVHKAQPIRVYKPISVQPSHKQPTIAESPEFATKKRLGKKF